jgi:TPP-dependent pyruvate/acetoin dehydrogenase alpha subunit
MKAENAASFELGGSDRRFRRTEAEESVSIDPGLAPVQTRSELADLIDPAQYTDPIDISGASTALLERLLHDMRLIRLAEDAIGRWVESNVARAPCHLGIGQEAVAVGVSAHLRRTDRVFGGHRSHSHYLALGGELYALLAEVLGKADGASRGMGGSMHLCAQAAGFVGSVPLVGATIPIAVGAGLAAKMQRSDTVSVTYFGDGATEEGVLHESLNLASLYKLPVLFVCENNLYSSHLDITARQPSDRVARFAEAHRIKALTIDGNDVLAVSRAAQELIGRARRGDGPGFLEAVTYRHRGHVSHMEDIDVGVRRKMEDLIAWKRRDPIHRLEDAMVNAGAISRAELAQREAAVRQKVTEACTRALIAPYPPTSALLNAVFISEAHQ